MVSRCFVNCSPEAVRQLRRRFQSSSGSIPKRYTAYAGGSMSVGLTWSMRPAKKNSRYLGIFCTVFARI